MNYRDNKPMVPLVISTLTQDKCCTEIKTKFYDSLRKRKNWDVISGKKYTDSLELDTSCVHSRADLQN